MTMYTIPDDEYDDGIKHAMLHADLGQIYDLSREKSKLHHYTDFQKILRKYLPNGCMRHRHCHGSNYNLLIYYYDWF